MDDEHGRSERHRRRALSPGADSAELEEEHWRSEQSGHLDGIIHGLFLLMNMMTGHAWVGVYLNSGSYIHALKQLALEEFWRFKVEFPTYQLADGSGTLKDKMYGSNDQAKLRAAWNAYASFKLRHLERPWKRVYVKIPEGALLLSSMCTFHFGARFPMVFRKKAVPGNLWHMRMHMYFGSKLFRNPSADPEAGIVHNPAQETTIDIFSTDPDYDWLSPAQALALKAWGASV